MSWHPIVRLLMALSTMIAWFWRRWDRSRAVYAPGRILVTSNSPELLDALCDSVPGRTGRQSTHARVAYSGRDSELPILVTNVLSVPPGRERAVYRWCRFAAADARSSDLEGDVIVSRAHRVYPAAESKVEGVPAVTLGQVHDNYLELLGLAERPQHHTSVVAILDTAFEIEQLPIEQLPEDVRDRVTQTRTGLDPNGHGAATCAVIAAGCPDAKLVCFAVISGEWGDETEVISALGQLLIDEPALDVINMSLSIPKRKGEQQLLTFKQWADRHIARGTVLLAATGNCKRGCDGIFLPASTRECVAVGSVDANLAISNFSRRQTPEKAAENLIMAFGGQWDETGKVNESPLAVGERWQVGTSIACAYAAATIAAISADLRAADRDALQPGYGRTAMKWAVEHACQDAPAYDPWLHGHGIIRYTTPENADS